MEEMKYRELEDRASLLHAEKLDIIRKLEARAVIAGEIELMRQEGKALTLTEEEISMLESFRRFKLRMRKDGEVFRWQTRRPEGVVLAEETAEVVMPKELL